MAKRTPLTAPSWLLKTEPTEYSFDQLVADGQTDWDGVSNAQALQGLRSIRPGDRLLIYHTGDQRQIVGEAVCVTAMDDAANPLLRIAAGSAWPRPVTLAQVKAEPALAGWALVRQSRLSVVPIDGPTWAVLERLRGG